MKVIAEHDIMRRVYEDYDAHHCNQYLPSERVDDTHPRLVQLLRLLGTGKRVLDIGASRGDFAAFLKDKGNDVVAIDISSKAVETCRHRGLEAFQVNVETTALPECGKFDVVIMLEILEHLIDPLIVLRRVRPLINPGGSLVVSTPNAAYIKWRLDLAFGRMPDFGENRHGLAEMRPYNLLHKTPMTIGDLRKLLCMSGFEMVHLEAEDYGAGGVWSRPGMKQLRNRLRTSWPSMFAGAVVVKATSVSRL